MNEIDIEKLAKAIEADMGEPLPDLRRALAEAKSGIGRITTPEQIRERQVKKTREQAQTALAECN